MKNSECEILKFFTKKLNQLNKENNHLNKLD